MMQVGFAERREQSGERRAGRFPAWCASASFDMAIIAPVLPAETAASARPSFTALIAMPIEVVRARRIAWLGFSVASIASGESTMVKPESRRELRSSSARTCASAP